MAGSLRRSALSALVALGCLVTPAAAATRAGHGFEAAEPAPMNASKKSPVVAKRSLGFF